MRPDMLTQVMSLEAALVRFENYKFENEKILGCGVGKKRAYQIYIARYASLIEASCSRLNCYWHNTPKSQAIGGQVALWVM